MLVRREVPADRAAVREIVGRAFRQPAAPAGEPEEVGLLDALRTSPAWLPKLSLVAEPAGSGVVGHVACTRAWVGDVPVVALAPIAVDPNAQRHGVGAALMHAILAAAEALDEPLVGLLGSVTYYRRFGFVPAGGIGIHAPDPAWGEHFQARTLAGYRSGLVGQFRYAEPFGALG